MISVDTTEGVLDASGEQIEVFTKGDTFRITVEAILGFYGDNYDVLPGRVYIVESIEFPDADDLNNFVLIPACGTVPFVHRMDAEHVTKNASYLVTCQDQQDPLES